MKPSRADRLVSLDRAGLLAWGTLGDRDHMMPLFPNDARALGFKVEVDGDLAWWHLLHAVSWSRA